MLTRLTTLIDQILPIAILVCGIGLTAAWVTFLGYRLVSLIEYVI
jgi:hypothetical protein